MMTLFGRGGSLAALAAALALSSPAMPAAAEEMLTVQPDDPASSAEVRIPRSAPTGGPARAEIMRAERPERPRFEPVATPQPTYTPPPAYTPPTRIDPDVEAGAALAQRDRGDRRGRGGGGFGGGFGGGQTAQPAPQPAPLPRADRQGGGERGERRGWRGGEVRDGGDIWRGQRGEDRARGWQRGQTPAVRQQQQQDWQGQRRDQGVIRQGAVTARGTDWQQGRGGWGDGRRDDWRRDGWQDRGRDGWQGGNRSDWRNDRRGDWRGNDWRADRRDGWRGNDWRNDRRGDDWRRGDRRNWRQDDWRWSWNGRPGWDNRDFRRWDNRWRNDRRFDWFDFRRSNRFIFQPGPYFAPFRSHRYNRLSIGFALDSLFFQPRFFINDPWAYHLPPVYGPYQWIRYYDDVVLVDIYTGEVVDVLHDFFW